MATKVASKFGMQVSGTATSAGTHGHPCHPKNWQHRLGVEESVKKWRSWRTSGSSVNLLCNGTLESHPSTGRRKQQLFGLEWRVHIFHHYDIELSSLSVRLCAGRLPLTISKTLQQLTCGGLGHPSRVPFG